MMCLDFVGFYIIW